MICQSLSEVGVRKMAVGEGAVFVWVIKGEGSEWGALWARFFSGCAPRRGLDPFLRYSVWGRAIRLGRGEG